MNVNKNCNKRKSFIKMIKKINRNKMNIMFLLIGTLFWFSSPIFGNNPSSSENLNMRNYNNEYEVIHFFTNWCNTCKKQKISIDKIKVKKEFSTILFKTVNFSESLDLRKKFNVQHRSTILILKNDEEISRIFGVTNVDQLTQFIRKAI